MLGEVEVVMEEEGRVLLDVHAKVRGMCSRAELEGMAAN